MSLAGRIARRELRGGIAGFRVFLLCLILGVAAVAGVGTLRAAIERGLTDQGAILLGGDAQLEFTYRYATESERAWMAAHSEAVSEIVDFRSMAVVGQGDTAERALTQVKAVDDLYPLVGAVALAPQTTLAEALAPLQGVPGAVMDPVLADRLGLAVGDRFRLGLTEFRLTARLTREPDSATGGFGLGPRLIVRREALAGAGLLEPGSLYETAYRLRLPAGADLATLKTQALSAFEGVRECAGKTAAARPPEPSVSSSGSARFWCWSGWPGWPWAGWAFRPPCAPGWSARSRPSRH